MLKSLNATSKKFWSHCGLFGAAINSEFSQKVLPTAHYIVNLEKCKSQRSQITLCDYFPQWYGTMLYV